jgi:O-antigen/teichoic acid export membrane protein
MTDLHRRNATASASVLVVISGVGSVLGVATSILFARLLGPAGFQEFAVAIAGLSLAGTLCEFGTGKYAMRIMPQYANRKQWSFAAGFLRYSALMVVATSLFAGLVGFLIAADFGAETAGLSPLALAFLFLPTTAAVAVAAEFLMANRNSIAGSVVIRLICPLTTLMLFGMASWLQLPLFSHTAIFCFGGGGVAGLLAAIFLFRRSASPEMFSSKPEFRGREWTRHCLWYLLLAFLMSWLMKLSLVVLKAGNIGDLEIAQFAAALEIACFILIIAKSTNKFYQPELALIMSSADWIHFNHLKQQRLALIGVACIAFFVVVLIFGRQILGWFGDEFVPGYIALCFMSAGTCTATAFSMAPEYLKFADRLKTILLVNCAAGILLIVLTWVLAKSHGVSGAGFAFGLVLILAAIAFRVLALRQHAIEIGSTVTKRSV